MRKKFVLDLTVGVAAYIEMIALTLSISKKYSLSLFMLLPFLTLALVVIYSQHFASSTRKWHEKEERDLLIMQ